jgi:tRNA dimethylallyltransferase
LICIVGPTATGKTRLAISLAQRFGAEIINADSRQVYRGMDIGTAKPTPAERSQARHHLLDLLDPSESFGVALFLELASKALANIRERSTLPIVAGGAGQYVWALAEGQHVPAVPPAPEFRAELEAEAERLEPDALHRRLAVIDPARAAALDARNVRRVIRALEIHHVTGRLPSELQPVATQTTAPLILGLTMPRDALYRHIDQRVDRMMQDGFLGEVQALASAGYPMGAGPLDSPGYRELGQYLDGSLSLEEAVQRTKTQTHRLARRQYAWFKLSDSRIHWLDAADPAMSERAAQAVSEFLNSWPSVIQ